MGAMGALGRLHRRCDRVSKVPMDVVLVTTRSANTVAHWSRAMAADVAAALVAQGARVTWLCPLGPMEGAPAADGILVQPLPGSVPAFRQVLARVEDTAVDVALARVLRPLARPIVVHFGFGAPGSVTTLWLAERMGARGVAVLRAAEALCHRGTLVDATGNECRQCLDAARCAACARAPWPEGLSPAQAVAAVCLRPLAGWSPYPSENAFLSRTDLVLASLLSAIVVVADPVDADLMVAAGIAARSVRLVEAIGGLAEPAAVVTEIAALAATVSSPARAAAQR